MSFLSVERAYVDSCSCVEKACAVLHLGWLHPICRGSSQQGSSFQLQCSLIMNSQAAVCSLLASPTALSGDRAQFASSKAAEEPVEGPGCQGAPSAPGASSAHTFLQ